MINRPEKIRRLLAANRGEIAIRICRAASELGIETVAIYSNEDRFALHRFKADESYLIGEGKGPVEAYLDIETIIRVAKDANVDAIHPGYGLLSENPTFARRCEEEGLIFVGPKAEVMEGLGNKVSARNLAVRAGAPVVPATNALPDDEEVIKAEAAKVGYPMITKASWGGGGRGMREIESEAELLQQVDAAKREAKAAFGNDELYLEKLVRRARHVEVQIIGDTHGNVVHLFERDCSVQRRNQKVVERAPAPYLNDEKRTELCEAALKIARTANYSCAGTVEFLMDVDTEEFYFIEVNPRVQVEHTVTEVVTGIDIVQAQIRICEGAMIGRDDSGVPAQEDIKLNGHSIQCRVTTEDPENNFIPDYGKILAYRGATGFGIRLDGGTAFSGALVTRYYDSLLEKVTAWGASPNEAVARMDRALREFRIRGVATNLTFLENVLSHEKFLTGAYTTKFIDTAPELFDMPKRQDRASKLLNFLGEVMVNGNPEVAGRIHPNHIHHPSAPNYAVPIGDGLKQKLANEGPKAVADWMLAQDRLLLTDTTMRDAHQSLLATRVRTDDLVKIAPSYAARLPELFSVECWGGATFDVAMRFLKECPWERLERLSAAMPNHLTQMLLRASNGVGYTNYPDNAVKYLVERAANAGMDVFRVFDSLNWVENMRVAMDAVLDTGKMCEATVCYTGDTLDANRSKYDLKYYVDMAKELEGAGAHILAIKDMAGLLKPAAATQLFSALKNEISIPVHFHTHDTSGIAAASILAAAEAGVDAVDAALDSMSGLTSQANLGSIVAALKNTPRDTGLDQTALRKVSDYWEAVRANYVGFESDIRCGTSDVYNHEMPGGQYTNLRQQARSLGIEEHWSEVSDAYADVNQMFGDIVKVTPSSKVVGDMALMMVTSSLSRDDVENPDKEIAFPDSVVSFFKGELGQPTGGFPKALQDKVLKGETPITVRPGSVMDPLDLDAERKAAEEIAGRTISENELASYIMYPAVFRDYVSHQNEFGDVTVLPTGAFFYGMEAGEEMAVDIAKGKTLFIRFRAMSDADEEGRRTVFFELNGQPRNVKITDKATAPQKEAAPKAEDGNENHVGAPMPGLVVSVAVKEGDEVERGDVLCSIEAMKMETSVLAEKSGTIERVVSSAGTQVDTKDLLVVLG
ncbi:Pyruvate carboxylase [Candidatus Terasakiella magnetica]|uniref:Pyruvate carboxylase n=1 Tax=Candidatus Terasakiella magnetica TaxID=1867952 RepID=A0A1C3RHV5_9PROT|nr:pyruvate carboxylase [Candidatus Terasakiella magnetica]SCA56845.1 Pyruvate carboxylase [Candidatus Terasakiella magnetica]